MLRKVVALALAVLSAAWFDVFVPRGGAQSSLPADENARQASELVQARRAEDLAAIIRYRPGYQFWRHVFTIPDGHVAYGSAVDGRLLVVFPTKGDWLTQADWKDTTLAHVLDGKKLAAKALHPRYLQFEKSGLAIQVPAAEVVSLKVTRR